METQTHHPRDQRREYHRRSPVALQSCIGVSSATSPYRGDENGSSSGSASASGTDSDDAKKRRRGMSKTQLVKRLRLSFHDWQQFKRRNRLDRRTTARESTLALLKKLRTSNREAESCGSAVSVDPITRERIPRDSSESTFTFRRGSAVARIDAGALIDYILSTGDYSDPESRIPFDDSTLSRLDQIGARLGKRSVLKARIELQEKFAERQFLRDAMCGLERVCGESVSQMFDLVEQVNENSQPLEDAHIQLLTFVMPEFQNNLTQLAEADRSFAKHSAMQFEAFLKGPPNRPVKSTQMQLLVLEMFNAAVEDAMRE